MNFVLFITQIKTGNKGNEVVPQLEVWSHTAEDVPPTIDDMVLEEPPSDKGQDYGHYHEKGGTTHFCKVILAPNLDCILISLDFTKHSPAMPTEFKMKTDTTAHGGSL